MNLSGLTIGSLTLTPTFDKNTVSYTATTYNATNKITATPEVEDAEITILVNDVEIENETSATWEEGENEVSITVENEGKTKEYIVTVNYYPHVNFTFFPEVIEANEESGIVTSTVVIQGTAITVNTAECENEHISVEVNGATLTVTSDDDSIFASGFEDIEIEVEGFEGQNPASGTLKIVELEDSAE